MIQVGDKIPDTLGINQSGQQISLEQFRGRKLILYFYPKDMTPGCTQEACNLRDNYDALFANGFSIIGVSADSQASHQRFSEKNTLPFPLISDPEHKLCDLFGVYTEKHAYGRTFMGIVRTTFVIDADGIVVHIFQGKEIRVKDHASQILALGV